MTTEQPTIETMDAKIKYSALSEANKALCDKLSKDLFEVLPHIGMNGIVFFIADCIYKDYQSKIDYWKERCEAAEALVGRDATNNNWDTMHNKWMELVNQD